MLLAIAPLSNWITWTDNVLSMMIGLSFKKNLFDFDECKLLQKDYQFGKKIINTRYTRYIENVTYDIIHKWYRTMYQVPVVH